MINNCIILDDEQHAIDVLQEYISRIPNLKLLYSFKNPLDAIPILKEGTIDIAFIDVQMPNLTGIQFSQLLPKTTKIILCTAYPEYALDGFELNVVDYLLKPFSFERFWKAIEKVDQRNQPIETNQTPEVINEYIFVKAEAKGKYTKVNLNDINYIEGLGNYQKLQLTDNHIVTQLKMKNLESQLAPYGFIRVHKSFLVPLQKINLIEGNTLKINKHEVPIGQNFKEGLFKILKDKMLE
jgi:DNA-binding LytR/AlgR family response regulator